MTSLVGSGAARSAGEAKWTAEARMDALARAIVWQPHDEHGEPTGEPLLYLVRETKSTHELDALRLEEARKIRCGERHFREALGVSYEVVTNSKGLPGIV